MPGAESRLLAVDSERPDGAPDDVRVELFGARDPDLEAGDRDEAEGELSPPNPFMSPL